MPTKTPIKIQEKSAILVGFFLIVLVAAITVARSLDLKKQTAEKQGEETADASLEKYETISTPDLQNKITKKAPLTLLDVRSDEAYTEEHVVDSLHIPVDDLANATTLDKTKPLYLLAENSQDETLGKALEILNGRNFTNVTVLAGGMESWKNLGGQVITSGDPTLFVNQAKVRFITADELKDSLENNKIFLIDARLPKDYAEGHLKGAVNIPFEELEKRRAEIPSSKTIVVYDANEVLGFQSAARIYDLLAFSVYDLRGGFENWKNNNLEIVK